METCKVHRVDGSRQGTPSLWDVRWVARFGESPPERPRSGLIHIDTPASRLPPTITADCGDVDDSYNLQVLLPAMTAIARETDSLRTLSLRLRTGLSAT